MPWEAQSAVFYEVLRLEVGPLKKDITCVGGREGRGGEPLEIGNVFHANNIFCFFIFWWVVWLAALVSISRGRKLLSSGVTTLSGY